MTSDSIPPNTDPSRHPESPRSDTTSTRRQVLTALGLTASVMLAAPSLLMASDATPKPRLPSVRKPNGKVRFAAVGVGGMGSQHAEIAKYDDVELVGLCDVDQNILTEKAQAQKARFPNLKTYRDYREMLNLEDIDALLIATPDHMHAPISLLAMSKGIHVYCEKPLTRTVWEARQVRKMAAAPGLATQMGNWGSASEVMRRSLEVLKSGILGNVTDIHVWTNRPIWPQGLQRPAGSDPVPAHLDWELWQGVAPRRPYKNGAYHQFNWRAWHDYGAGAIGDIYCHTLDLPSRAYGLTDPSEIIAEVSDQMPECYPVSGTIHYTFPARQNRGAIKVHWYEGKHRPPKDVIPDVVRSRGELPEEAGLIIAGDQGVIFGDKMHGTSQFFALKGESKLLAVGKHPALGAIAKTLPRSPGHRREWIDAIKGGPAPFCAFDIGAQLTETAALGCIAERFPGKKLLWDSANMCFSNCPEARHLLKPTYPPGWTV